MKVRRKIVALGTALAMAFVMIASLVMVTDVKAANTPVSKASFSFVKPEAGVTVHDDGYGGADVHPTIRATSVGMENSDDYPSGMYWASDKLPTEQAGTWKPFYGTFEDGKTYYVEFYGRLEDYYEFADGFAISDVTVTNGKVTDMSIEDHMIYVVASFVCGDEPAPDPDPDPDPDPTPTPSSDVPTISDGSTVEVAPAEDGTVTFRFEKDLEYFENGGKLYIDGQEVPADMYKATRGSTIITLFKEYAAKLADGAEHAVKVVFNNGETVEGKLVVKAASSDSSASTAANGTSGTASSTAATTTKVTSPKTADVLPIAGIALVFVGATAIGVIAFRRKNS